MVHEFYARDFVCGLGAAVTTTAITFPVNKLIYRQVLVGGNLGKAFNSIRNEGMIYLYRGAMPPLLQKATCLSTMFGVYSSVTTPLKKYHLNEYVEKICGSCVSATVEAAFVPFERIQVLLVHTKYNQRFRNMAHTFLEVHKHFGVREFYRGFTIVWIRNIASNCCFFITKGEIAKTRVMHDNRYTEGLKNFISGGLLGVMMSTFFYPCKVMKIVLHQNLGGRFLSLRETAVIVYRRNGRGMRNFYTGVLMNGVRSLLSWDLLIDISDVLQICCYELGRTYLKLSQALCINIPAVDPCLYILRFASKLQFGPKTQQVANTALRLVQRMKRDSIHSGRRPSGLCGAALLIAARLHEFGRSPKDIVKIVKVHESTLRKRLIEFGDTPSSALTLDEFMNVDLEEEQDPPSFKAARKKDKERLQKLLDEEADNFTDLQKQIEEELEHNIKKRKSIKGVSLKSDELADERRFIEQSTMETVSQLLGEEAADDPQAAVAVGLGPDVASMGLAASLEDVSNAPRAAEAEAEAVDLDLEGIDDAEIDAYIMDDREFKYKNVLWHRRNADYLEEQKVKAERLQKEREEGKPEKKRKRPTKRRAVGPASSAGEAIEKIMQEKKISAKINYDVLKSLSSTVPAPSEPVDTGADAAASESIKRRRMSSLPETSRGRKTKEKMPMGLPVFEDSPIEEPKEIIENEGKNEKEEENEKEKTTIVSDDDLDEDYEDDEQPTEANSEIGVLQMLRQHREDEEDPHDFGYDYYDDADY